jgi:outer membrane biosynthesis protein TonB
MKFLIGTTALFLMFFSTPAFAQDEPKPQQQEEHKPQDSKAPEPEKAPPAKPEAGQPKEKQAPPEKAQPAAKAQTDEKQQQEQKTQEKQTQDQQKQAQKSAQQPQKQQQAQSHPASSGGNSGGNRIPDDKFRAHFGAQHHFRPARGNNGRFQYGGYWFVYTDAWPSGWSYDDDCYIEDDGGVYYLIDALHPDLRLVVVVQAS